MSTLILIPLYNIYINPEEIACIYPGFTPDKAVITLRGNVAAVTVNMSVDQVIDRLKKHIT